MQVERGQVERGQVERENGTDATATRRPGDARLRAEIASLQLVGHSPDPALDEIVRLAARITRCRKAFVTFVHDAEVFVLAGTGSDATQVPAATSVCGVAYMADQPLIVPDLTADPRFKHFPYVEMEGGNRFYAGCPVRLENGFPIGTLCVIDDRIRPQGLSEDELASLVHLTDLTVRLLEGRRRDARFSNYLEIASDWIWEQDAEFRFTYLSPSADRYLLQVEKFIGKTRWEAPSGNGECPEFWAEHRRMLEAHLPFRDVRFRCHRDGKERFHSISGRPVFGADGSFLGYRGTARDITDIEMVNRELEHLARHDPLTGLANRATFETRVTDAFRRWQETGEEATLFLLDLDHFKLVNDTFGHSSGDRLLMETAQRLRAHAGPQATVARLGGDEFAILEPSLARDGAIAEYAAGLAQAISVPVAGTDEHEGVECGCSMGIAVLPDHGGSFSQLMGNADLALYEAKTKGRGRFMVFDAPMRREADERNTLARELVEAVEQQQFHLLYQPVVRIADEAVIGAEALMRWNHPTRGTLPPGAFIAALDGSRQAADVGYWVLEEACRTARPWALTAPHGFRLSVNLFSGQLRDPRLVNRVRSILERTGFDGRNLDLEVTENILLAPGGDLAETLQKLKLLGIAIVLDDFGTGYGSLNHLLQFPIDRIKVDRQFVRGLGEKVDYNTVTHAVVKLAVDLGLKVTAEGIETEEQKSFLALIGCNDLQGFHFSRPVAAERIADLVGAAQAPASAMQAAAVAAASSGLKASVA